MSGVHVLDAGRVASAGGRGVFTGFTADGWVECSGRGENVSGRRGGGQPGSNGCLLEGEGGKGEEGGGRRASSRQQ